MSIQQWAAVRTNVGAISTPPHPPRSVNQGYLLIGVGVPPMTLGIVEDDEEEEEDDINDREEEKVLLTDEVLLAIQYCMIHTIINRVLMMNGIGTVAAVLLLE
jgi:hypothetical protein